jgi:hypothetical protein
MSALEQHHLVMLEAVLEKDYVQHLPALLDKTKPQQEQDKKNRSRAFSAFALKHLCGISVKEAAEAVVDDFDDFGIDAIYYHAPSETIYLVQSKMKAAEQFSQDEALAYCQGIRKMIQQDFTGFNDNVQKRKVEIEDALDNCSSITLVVAHTGNGISRHAAKALKDLLEDETHGEDRLHTTPVDYDSSHVAEDLRAAKAYERVDADLWVHKCAKVEEPRLTSLGLVDLKDLVALHDKHGKALYEKNIRTFLGHKTEVNASIRQTLADNPKDFMYLNNGVTALGHLIEPKGAKQAKQGQKRLKIKGFSVINGAQTIASSARFLADNPGSDISAARVALTLIRADTDGEFGKLVTRARNHQNRVQLANFSALDEEQERLRRELAHLGIHYDYKAGATDVGSDPNRIRIDEAAQALAMLQADPRYVVWLKKDAGQLLDTASDVYKTLFNPAVTPFQLANAVRLNRYIQGRAMVESKGAGLERLTYKHGAHALAWAMAKRLRTVINSAALIDEKKLKAELSAPFDELRQALWDTTRTTILITAGPPVLYTKGPLALFRNQGDVTGLLERLLINHFALDADPALPHKKSSFKPGQPYPIDLFAYLVSKAPQIGNLI